MKRKPSKIKRSTISRGRLGLATSEILGVGDFLARVAEVAHDTHAVLDGLAVHLDTRQRRLHDRDHRVDQTAALAQLVTGVLSVTAHVTTTNKQQQLS